MPKGILQQAKSLLGIASDIYKNQLFYLDLASLFGPRLDFAISTFSYKEK